jgi:hypothetical protein
MHGKVGYTDQFKFKCIMPKLGLIFITSNTPKETININMTDYRTELDQ